MLEKGEIYQVVAVFCEVLEQVRPIKAIFGFLSSKNNKKNKSLYLSVNVFSTAVLIEDTVNSETNIINQTETC